ncbi:MAG: LysM peptidoglycan-binding domain-containing protein [Legionellaceae bacterium]|nr:LysM peptidoglycan-binding domain-containing protein [Legionellaceae bacterium]
MRAILLPFLLCFALSSHALLLRTPYPQRYVVKPGDTLWSIAQQFLQKPWEWNALWQANPQINHPDRLYPGAVLVVDFDNHHPYLKVLSNGTVKWSPAKRPMPADEAIPPIHLRAIQPFLDSSLIVDDDALAHAPYIVAYSSERLLGGQGDAVYVRHLCPNPDIPKGTTQSYAIFRQGGAYREPVSNRLLGFKAILIGYAELLKAGEPSTILLTTIHEGVRLGDRVMPNDQPGFPLFFEPQAPDVPVRGSIIDLPGEYTQGATGLVAVLDRGKDSGLKPGDVLGIFSQPRVVRDLLSKDEDITLPAERIGEVMVFRSFSHTSFALVVRSTRAVHLQDFIGNP